jgi:precorrin-6B methylase 2
MSALQFLQRPLFAPLFGLMLATCSFAATAAATFEPQIGQEGKDVIWVPTPNLLIEKMLDAAKVTANDYVIDLGSGDGRTVIAAAKRGAKALGIEYNPDMVELSKQSAIKEGVTARANFMKADIFESDFSQATVITMYLLPQLNLKLRPKILDLKPGTRIVSHAFTMEEWRADETITAQDNNSYSRTAYLWIVPAKVEGSWQVGQGELVLKQSFQMLTGTLRSGSSSLAISNGRMRGDQISFTAGGAEYSGRVSGSTIEGSITGGSGGNWTASRLSGR